jgi:hypothetical protein
MILVTTTSLLQTSIELFPPVCLSKPKTATKATKNNRYENTTTTTNHCYSIAQAENHHNTRTKTKIMTKAATKVINK